MALQSKIWHFIRLYERHGVPVSGYTRLRKAEWPDADAVIVTRAYLEHDDLTDRVPGPPTLSSPGGPRPTGRRLRCRHPWSDHAFREELLAFIEAINPRLVWTFAGEGHLLRAPRRRTRRGSPEKRAKPRARAASARSCSWENDDHLLHALPNGARRDHQRRRGGESGRGSSGARASARQVSPESRRGAHSLGSGLDADPIALPLTGGEVNGDR